MTGPDRIFVQWPHQNSCGLAFTADGASGSRVEYIRRDPAVLAALPEVQAIVAAAVEAERDEWKRRAEAAEARALDAENALNGPISELTSADHATIVAHLSLECDPQGQLPNLNSLMMEIVRMRNAADAREKELERARAAAIRKRGEG